MGFWARYNRRMEESQTRIRVINFGAKGQEFFYARFCNNRMETYQMSKDEKIVEEGIDQYLRDRIGLSLKEATSEKRYLEISKSLTAFYASEIAQYRDQFDSDEIEQGLDCDGKNDAAMDFIVSHDGVYFIYQTKYRGGKGVLNRDEIAGFFQIYKRILSPSGLQNANDAVKDQLSDVSNSSRFRFFLLVNFCVSNEMRAEFNNQRERAREATGDADVEWLLKDVKEIAAEYRQIQSSDDKAPDVEIPLISLEPVVDKKVDSRSFIDMSSHLDDKKCQTIVTVIRGTTLRDLFKKHATALFDNNIRGYLGSTKSINKKIRDTIAKEPARFFLFNNGISAICTDMQIENDSRGEKRIACRSFQIINGAQTVSTIGESSEANLSQIWTLLRITKGEAVTTETGLNRQIVEFNNSQTVIRFSDFRSNDNNQKLLEKKFGDFRYKGEKQGGQGRKIVYVRKRHHYKKQHGTIYVTLENLAKSLFAFDAEGKPAKLYSELNFLFSSEIGSYDRLFGGDFSLARIRRTVAVAILLVFLENDLKEQRKKLRKAEKTNGIDYMLHSLKWHILHMLGYVIREMYPDREKKIVESVIDGRAFRENGFVTFWLGSIKKDIHTVLSLRSIAQDLNFKRWMRSEKGVEEIRGTISGSKYENSKKPDFD